MTARSAFHPRRVAQGGLALLLGALPAGCAASPKDGPDSADDGGSTRETDGGGSAPAGCPQRSEAVALGALDQAALNETSGLWRSPRREGLLWAHNDSGGAAEVFAVDQQARVVQRVQLTGATATDWEDLAGAEVDGQVRLFIGDVGDNGRTREELALWWIEEPAEGQSLAAATRVGLLLPEGPEDIEGIFIDPRDGDLYLLGKVLLPPIALYRAAAPLQGTVQLLREAGLDSAAWPEVNLATVTAADISPLGDCVYLRTYTQVLAFDRGPEESVADALARPPRLLLAGPEAQGEALAADERGYWTLSEGEGATLYQYAEPK